MTIFDDIYGKSFPFAIGFDRTLRLLEQASTVPSNISYPPYNIVKEDSENYCIELAIAGFGKKDIDITKEKNVLTIEGTREGSEKDFVHRGLASRNFKRSFTLADDVEVSGADMKDGILHVKLVRIIPEEDKPVSIKIK